TIGYIHAQERLWQLTLSQLAAEGRFAEFLGEDLLPYDIHQRTLGFWETSKRIESEAPEHLLHLLQQYADGINHFVEKNRKNLPVEFSLLGVEPIEWTPTHSIAVSRLMAWDQNMHWMSELTYAYLAENLDPVLLRQLIPVYDDSFPVMLSENHSNRAAQQTMSFLETELDLRSMLSKNGSPFGSNAWAVSGSITESGLPILAGDPHMGLSIPGFWYEMFVDSPDLRMAGATIPGAPFFVLGQNDQFTWSMTNIMADDTDFFLESVHSSNPNEYVADSLSSPIQTLPFDERREIIHVKGSNDKLHVVRTTQNGPIISDIHPNQELIDGKLVSLRWKGHDISHEMWALYRLNRSQSMADFRNAVEQFQSPGMNFIYADRDDNIAIFTGAALPIREHNPLAFRHGWDPSYQWSGTIPFDELPHVVNPESGFVAHANNKMHTDNYPHYISTFWEPPSRIQRIEQLLQAQDTLTTEHMQTMQFDVFSQHAADITDLILPILRSGPNPEQFSVALSYLENWNHEYEPASTAATIFDLFFMNLTENVLIDELGEDAYRNFIQLEHLPVMVISRMLRDDSSFFNVITTGEIESRSEIVRRAMAQTLEQLEETYGPESVEWRWENVNTLTLKPPLLGEASEDPEAPALFRMIVNNLFSKGPYGVRGHGMSINKGQYSWHRPFEMDLGASIRRIIDFSTPERTLSVLPTGQSGNPLSANYGDQTNLWLEGRYRYIYQDSTFFHQTSYQTMRLYPQ
ncbi:MAG: penicillin acylase family protein, partial [Balneolaceae bacterium]|nr:penicillin acylase family protein [Balneolaceae bacterium]